MPTTHRVEIRNFAYNPATVTIESGDSVEWTNRDSTRHNAQRDDPPQFRTDLLNQNQTSAPVQFTSIGTFDYYCQPHPSMTGRVVVTGENTRVQPKAALALGIAFNELATNAVIAPRPT